MKKEYFREILMCVAIGTLATFLPCWDWTGALDRIMAAAVMSLVLIGNL
ncbi:hypothetical protein [Blautia obeum]|jgi:hypothetical protein|nr:hypothetical protein [Blautia obeum]